MKKQTGDYTCHIPWGWMIGILLSGVLISAGIVLFRWNETINMHSDESLGAASMREPDGITHTLTFVDENGQILEQQKVNDGDFAIPPKLESVNDGTVFRCWSRLLYGIGASAEVTAMYQDMRQSKNVFYIDSQYAQLGEKIQLQLWLSGQVCLSDMKLTIYYDPDVLVDFQCDVENSPFEIVAQEKGSVTLCLDTEENLTEAISVAGISFEISENSTKIAKTKIHLEMQEPKMNVNGDDAGTDSNAVHGEVYILN